MWICFIHRIFRFLFLVTFGNEVPKIHKYYVIFVYILQDKMGKTERKKENHETKWPKDKKYGINETFITSKSSIQLLPKLLSKFTLISKSIKTNIYKKRTFSDHFIHNMAN